MLLFMDGFDNYASVNDYVSQWYITETSVFGQPGLTGGRYGGLAVANGDWGWNAAIRPSKTVIVGGNWNYGDNTYPMRLFEGGGISGTLHAYLYRANNRFYAYNGNGTLLGTSKIFGAGWHHIQIKVTIDNYTGSFYLRVDGSDELALTNVDTQNGGSGYVDDIKVHAGNGHIFDDFFVFDDTGSYNNDIIRTGEPRIETLFVNGNGSTINFNPNVSSNWQAVDDGQQDGDTSYNEATNTGSTDLFTTAGVSQLTGAIFGVQPRTFAKRTQAGLRKLSPTIKSSSGGTYLIASGVVASSYTALQAITEVDPGTGVPWTVSGVTNAQFGYTISM